MKSRIVTKGKMIASIIGICVATLLIIFAFCCRYAEGGFRSFGNFFLGTFGMSFYGMMAAVIVACAFTLAGKSLKISAKYVVFFVLTFVSLILFIHTLTTTYLIGTDYTAQNGTGYVQLVYNYYDKDMGIPTFGGVVFGTICWALTKALTVWGAMILFGILLAVSVYFVGDFFYGFATGRIDLQRKPAAPKDDIEPSNETSSAEPVSNDEETSRQRAYRFLFEGQTYPEEVSSTPSPRYDVSQQSTLENSSQNGQSAQTILFGDNQGQQPQQPQNPGNSFFRPAQQPAEQQDDVVRGYFNQPTESATDQWRVTTPTQATPTQSTTTQTSTTQSAPASSQSAANPEVSPLFREHVEEEQTQQAEVPEFDNPVDVTDIFADNEEPQQPVSIEDEYTEDEESQSAEIDDSFEEEQAATDDDGELTPVHGETIIDTAIGPATQERIDFVTKVELKEAEKVHKYAKYIQPPVDLLNDVTVVEDTEADTRARAADAITRKLAVFKIKVEIADTIVGPSVTRYMFNVLSPTTRMSEFARYSDDLKACVEAQEDIRIEAPVHGTNQVGIEVANKVKRPVVLRSILESDTFKKAKGNLVFAIGQEITGKAVIADLSDMPHLLIAGATGSGKSVALNCLIVSMIYKYGPEYLRFMMVDPKFVELSRYNGIPHMLTRETITVTNDALAGMDYLINEMESRYQLFRQNGVGNIGEYNSRVNLRLANRLPYLVFIVDELADLMAASKQSFENKLQRLAQKSRAAGIHIVLATQRPDVKTITGTIKANLPCRMALKVSSPPDSMTIINCGGAEKLLGKGDMLFMSPSSADLERVQGAYISNDEIRSLVDYTRETNEVYYDDKISDEIFVSQKQADESAQEAENSKEGGKDKETQVDPLCKKALRFWLEKQGGRASIASIQRNLGIGFNRAGRIMDTLQKLGYVETLAPGELSSKPLRVLISIEELDNIFPNLQD